MSKTSKSSEIKNTGEIVLSTIKKLTKSTGWTTRTIVKVIKMEYKLNEPNLNRKIGRTLKRGVKLGFLQMENGRYRLHDTFCLSQTVNVSGFRSRRKPRKPEVRLYLRRSESN